MSPAPLIDDLAGVQAVLDELWDYVHDVPAIRAGKLPVNWPGGGVNVVTGNTAHGLGKIPRAVLIVSAGPAHYLDDMVGVVDDRTFAWQVSNVGGGAPPAGHLDDVWWIAVA